MSEKISPPPTPETKSDEEAWLKELNSKKTRDLLMSLIFNMKVYDFSSADVEDVVQDTMLKAASAIKAGRFDGSKAKLNTWLSRIAKNTAVDLLRRKKIRDKFRTKDLVLSDKDEPENSTDQIPSNEPDSREQYITAQETTEQQKALENSLTALPSEQREVWELRNKNVNFKEIAQLQGIGVETAKTRYRLVVEKLTRWMEKEKNK